MRRNPRMLRRMSLAKTVVATNMFVVVMVAVSCTSAHASYGTLQHLSQGDAGGNGPKDARFAAASKDATRVFFTTAEALTSDDRDNGGLDVYERHDGVTSLVSTGPGDATTQGSSAFAEFRGISEDGTHVFFTTSLPLVAEDTDNQDDVYERVGDTTRLISTGPQPDSGTWGANYEAVSTDGQRVLFSTPERLLPQDTDSKIDIYAWTAGGVELVSAWPGESDDPRDVRFRGASKDARVVAFETLTRVANNERADLYLGAAGEQATMIPGATRIMTVGGPWYTFGSLSADGQRLVYETDQSLVASDTDTWSDLYVFQAGSVRELSTGTSGGNGRFAATFARATPDGTHVLFTTFERLVPEDTDSSIDVYESSEDGVTLVSIGPAGGNGAYDADALALSEDGASAYFGTNERLTNDPFWGSGGVRLIYKRENGTTTLISQGQFGPINADSVLRWISPDGQDAIFVSGARLWERKDGLTTKVAPQTYFWHGSNYESFRAASPDGARVVFETENEMLGSDRDDKSDLYEAGSGDPSGYARPQGATPLRIPLVPAYEQCAEPNAVHASSTSWHHDSCNPPRASSRYLTVGTADANGQPARSVGSLRMDVLPGDPATTKDEGDVKIKVSLTDVRRQTDLSDYTGALQVRLTLRLTDKANGSEEDYPGTATDFDVAFSVPCSPTDNDPVGSTCSLDSSLRGVQCCLSLEGNRAILGVRDVQVFDGGADGDVRTPDNTLFAWQGLFIP